MSRVDIRSKAVKVGKDKRQNPRIEFHCSVVIVNMKGTQNITDISIGGVFIELDNSSAFNAGQPIELIVKLPTEQTSMKLKAVVASCLDRGIGCKFVDLTPRQKDAIEICFDTFKDTIPLR